METKKQKEKDIEERTFVDLWNECDDEELANFIRMLRVTDAISHLFSDSADDSEGVDYALAEAAYDERLKNIEKHKLFKLLLNNADFSKAYDWIESARAPQSYKTSEGKIRLLESMVISFTLYARRIGGKRKEPDIGFIKDKIEAINRKAEMLKKEIKKAGSVFDDPNFSAFLNSIQDHLEFLAVYKPLKPLRNDGTFQERTFLLDLVRWLRRHNLPRQIAFITRVLKIDENITIHRNERNLREHVKSFEERCDQENQETRKIIAKLKSR